MLYPASPTSGVPDVNSVLQVSYMEITASVSVTS